ncbi:guanine-1-methyltransferase-domain-containing protein [Paraphysoderma sedebokerense]|nr:guanine-1-methyltransferase-domain-containing protein [Paraphysoderma sedebokerense]
MASESTTTTPPEAPDQIQDAQPLEEQPKLSKNQLKKLRKQAEWEKKREERKETRKLKKKQDKERKKELKAQGLLEDSPKTPKVPPVKQKHSGVNVAIDCAFDEFMTDKELKSLAKQIAYCYSVNRRSAVKADIHVTDIGSKLEAAMQHSQPGYKDWKKSQINLTSDTLITVFPDTSKITYLTADSDNTLTKLEPGRTYILGGIVDKNRHKNICLKKAKEMGIHHAKLPISEFVSLASRKVLTVNHCFEIMLKYLVNEDWEKAFLEVIPKRKGIESKSNDADSENGNGEAEEGIDKEDNEAVDEEEARKDLDEIESGNENEKVKGESGETQAEEVAEGEPPKKRLKTDQQGN